MRIKEAEKKRVTISSVDLWPKNPRKITQKNYERLKSQIRDLGLYKSLLCYRENSKYITLGGNQRLRVLREFGVKEVDIRVVKPKSEAEKIKYALSDNDEVGITDEALLSSIIMPHIKEINLEDYRVGTREPVRLEDVIEKFILDGREDETPEIDDSPAVTKMGDMYAIGDHRLLCGDATKEEDINRLMDGKRAGMVFTDPPYGINLNTDWSSAKSKLKFYKEKGCKGHGNQYPRITGDSESFNPSLILKTFKSVKEIFLWGAEYYYQYLKGGSLFVWDKRLSEAMDRMFGSCFELCWSKRVHKREIVRVKWAGIFGTEKEPDKDKGRKHPTQKPVLLSDWFIKKFSRRGSIVVDVFLGSGGTMISCERLGRICYSMEIEPKYCDLIISRFSAYAGIPEADIRKTREREKRKG